MNKKAPAFQFGNQSNPALGSFGFSKRKWRNAVSLAAVGVLAVALLIFGILTRGNSAAKVQYSSADIVYGAKIHAVHDMSSSAVSQHSNAISANPRAKPEIFISVKYSDFGTVNSGLVLTRTFTIANSGQSPLIIERAYTTCGCTIADFSATDIPPGKVVLMTLQFDTGFHDMRGTTVRRGVMIETNDPDHPLQEIWIQATIR